MKIVKSETAGAGHERFVFHISRDEIRTLTGVINPAILHTPILPETERIRHQLRQMIREMNAATRNPQ